MTEAPRTIVVEDEASGEVLGFVRIDSTVKGRARGGLRLLPDVSVPELEALARAMTLKYGFLGLPQGGAKGGVIGRPDAPPDDRAARLRRFAMAAAPLLVSRGYVPDADMGTTGPDIQRMLASVGIRLAAREYRGTRSGRYTAGTVFESARAAADAQGFGLEHARVAIEGFGKVGEPLAEMFATAGTRVVAVSTASGGVYNPRGLDVAALRERASRSGDPISSSGDLGDLVDTAGVKRVPAEIFCPCARHDSVLEDDAAAMTASVISCGANSPVTPGAERLLRERGVLCVPDFVANAGGVLGGTMEFAGWRPAEIAEFCHRHFGPRVASLIAEARRTGQPLRALAEMVALARFDRVKGEAERGTWTQLGIGAALAAYREGWVPAGLVRHLSAGYFLRRVS